MRLQTAANFLILVQESSLLDAKPSAPAHGVDATAALATVSNPLSVARLRTALAAVPPDARVSVYCAVVLLAACLRANALSIAADVVRFFRSRLWPRMLQAQRSSPTPRLQRTFSGRAARAAVSGGGDGPELVRSLSAGSPQALGLQFDASPSAATPHAARANWCPGGVAPAAVDVTPAQRRVPGGVRRVAHAGASPTGAGAGAGGDDAHAAGSGGATETAPVGTSTVAAPEAAAAAANPRQPSRGMGFGVAGALGNLVWKMFGASEAQSPTNAGDPASGTATGGGAATGDGSHVPENDEAAPGTVAGVRRESSAAQAAAEPDDSAGGRSQSSTANAQATPSATAVLVEHGARLGGLDDPTQADMRSLGELTRAIVHSGVPAVPPTSRDRGGSWGADVAPRLDHLSGSFSEEQLPSWLGGVLEEVFSAHMTQVLSTAFEDGDPGAVDFVQYVLRAVAAVPLRFRCWAAHVTVPVDKLPPPIDPVVVRCVLLCQVPFVIAALMCAVCVCSSVVSCFHDSGLAAAPPGV